MSLLRAHRATLASAALVLGALGPTGVALAEPITTPTWVGTITVTNTLAESNRGFGDPRVRDIQIDGGSTLTVDYDISGAVTATATVDETVTITSEPLPGVTEVLTEHTTGGATQRSLSLLAQADPPSAAGPVVQRSQFQLGATVDQGYSYIAPQVVPNPAVRTRKQITKRVQDHRPGGSGPKDTVETSEGPGNVVQVGRPAPRAISTPRRSPLRGKDTQTVPINISTDVVRSEEINLRATTSDFDPGPLKRGALLGVGAPARPGALIRAAITAAVAPSRLAPKFRGTIWFTAPDGTRQPLFIDAFETDTKLDETPGNWGKEKSGVLPWKHITGTIERTDGNRGRTAVIESLVFRDGRRVKLPPKARRSVVLSRYLPTRR